jgi:drug/metabolite transporter (DMT)-like permease
MSAILFSILCSSFIVLLFKIFQRYQIDTFQAIYFNYYTCVASAWFLLRQFPIPIATFSKPWFPYAFCLGFFFITGFNAVGGTVKHFNVALGSVMQKMTIIFVVFFSYFYLGENLNFPKILGVLFAIIAIFFTAYNPDNQKDSDENVRKHTLMDWLRYPVAALLLCAVIDVLLLYLQKKENTNSADISFIATLFGTAGFFGTIYFIYALIKGEKKLAYKNILAGVALGIPNFASIFYLLEAIATNANGAVVFTSINVGIIILSPLLALIILREKISSSMLLGILLAVVAILLINYDDLMLYFEH